MKIQQFWEVFESCGNELSVEGFEFTGNSWVFYSDDFKLSFEAPSDRYCHWLQVRFLTLCLIHKNVSGPDDPEPWLSDLLNLNCPVQISPELLPRYKSARFKRRVWHYSIPRGYAQPNRLCYMPVYYGGADKWILKDTSGSEAQNRDALMKALKEYGIDYISEQSCIEKTKCAVNAVAEASIFWAESMSPSTVLAQLRRYGSDWWVEKEWVRGYQQHDV